MEQLFEEMKQIEMRHVVNEERTVREYIEGCAVEGIAAVASYFVRIIDPDSLPRRMFDFCDRDNNGHHCFEEAVRFAAITSDDCPLDRESWQAVCTEAHADPDMGLRFSDYAKLMEQGGESDVNDDLCNGDLGDPDQNGADHAFTARLRDRTARGMLDYTVTAAGLTQTYEDLYVRSAPTASVNVFDSLFDTNGGEKSSREAREILSQLSAKPDPIIADDDDPTNDVGEILRELGNVTDLTGLAPSSPEKKRRRRKKKTNDPDKPKPKKKEAKEKRTTKGLRTARLKTLICRNWQEGNCKFGDGCGFAHGETEVQNVIQQGCPNWKDNGACEVGNSCMFTHNGK